MKHLTWELPSSIEVTTSQTASVITVYDAIWIHHGDDLEHKFLSQLFCLWSITDKEIDDTLHHVRGV